MEKYLLHINEPCTENWESMSTAEQGKFCNHCNKTVFDFTTATDAEIVKHIKAMKGEMFCGRFEENQLDRWIERSDIKTSNPRLYKFLISFMLLGAAQVANAQINPAQEKVATQRRLDSLLNLENTKSETGGIVCDTIEEKAKRQDQNLRIRIGGVTSISTHDQPLVIMDGRPLKKGFISKLDPKKITAITVLKSAESQALYGSKGTNGVIVITSSYTNKQLRKML